jgi:hypothetical protein
MPMLRLITEALDEDLVERGVDTHRHVFRFRDADVARHDGELVAAEAGDRPPRARWQPDKRHLLQQRIACRVTNVSLTSLKP